MSRPEARHPKLPPIALRDGRLAIMLAAGEGGWTWTLVDQDGATRTAGSASGRDRALAQAYGAAATLSRVPPGGRPPCPTLAKLKLSMRPPS